MALARFRKIQENDFFSQKMYLRKGVGDVQNIVGYVCGGVVKKKYVYAEQL